MSRRKQNRRFLAPCARLFCAIAICLSHRFVAADSIDSKSTLPTDQQLSDMIDELDDLSYEEREKSEQKLKALGPKIIPQLKKLASADSRLSSESKFRVKRIIRNLEKEKRLRLALLLKQGKIEQAELKKIPGWTKYSKIFGDTPEQQALFLKLYSAEPELWYAYAERPRDALREAIDSRCFELQYGLLTGKRYNAPPISTLSLLIADCRTDLQQVAIPRSTTIYSMAYSKAMRDALAVENETAKLYKKVISYWVENGKTTSDYYRLYLSLRYKLPAGRHPAIRIIKQNPNGRYVQTAVFALAKFGNTEDVDLLLPLLKNKTVLSPTRLPIPGKPVFSVQVRDVALVGLLVINKQDPKKFGFTKLRNNSIYLYSTNSAGFMNDTERDTAFEKWQKWADENHVAENSSNTDELNTE